LDNLYRAFSVPFGLFLPDSQLKPETLHGGEVGFDLDWNVARLSVTAYTNTIDDLLTSRNLTFAELPPGFFFGSRNINAGSTRARGVEAEVTWQITDALAASAGYSFAESILTRNPAEPASAGNQLAGVPRHQGNMQLIYTAPEGWRVSARARAISRSFADNLHTLPEDSQFVVDASASYPVFDVAEVYVDVQNLFDRRYVANNSGFNPPWLGQPFTVLGGVRVSIE
jgi:outer membrane receptor protein involved in Fe transport